MGKTTGLGGDESLEFEVLIEEFMNISEDTEAKSLQETHQKNEVTENAKNETLEERKVALKSMSQTRKTNSEEHSPSKMRQNRHFNWETFEFLKEKIEVDNLKRKTEYEEK